MTGLTGLLNEGGEEKGITTVARNHWNRGEQGDREGERGIGGHLLSDCSHRRSILSSSRFGHFETLLGR